MPFSCMLPELQDRARRMFKALNPVGSLGVGPTLRIHPLLPSTMHASIECSHIHRYHAWPGGLQPAAWLGCWGLQSSAGA